MPAEAEAEEGNQMQRELHLLRSILAQDKAAYGLQSTVSQTQSKDGGRAHQGEQPTRQAGTMSSHEAKGQQQLTDEQPSRFMQRRRFLANGQEQLPTISGPSTALAAQASAALSAVQNSADEALNGCEMGAHERNHPEQADSPAVPEVIPASLCKPCNGYHGQCQSMVLQVTLLHKTQYCQPLGKAFTNFTIS